MAKDFDRQLLDFQRALERQTKKANADAKKFVTMSCAEVERTAKRIMVESPTNPDVSYGKKGHHPSYAGNPPAPDTGTLMRSITHSVTLKGNEVVGEVGSIIHDSDYPKFLEYGTSKMKPRPWLSASLIKCQSWMANLWKEIFR
jgi:HK97 gp10 family phage protein